MTQVNMKRQMGAETQLLARMAPLSHVESVTRIGAAQPYQDATRLRPKANTKSQCI